MMLSVLLVSTKSWVGALLSAPYTELRHKLTFCIRVKMLKCAAAEYNFD